MNTSSLRIMNTVYFLFSSQYVLSYDFITPRLISPMSFIFFRM